MLSAKLDAGLKNEAAWASSDTIYARPRTKKSWHYTKDYMDVTPDHTAAQHPTEAREKLEREMMFHLHTPNKPTTSNTS
jgi:hypothetical protein